MNRRANDERKRIWDFASDMLLVCPRCEAPAWSRAERRSPCLADPFAPRRLTCTQCARTQEWRGNSTAAVTGLAPVRDGHFHLPLFLQVPCLGDTVWACNPPHLDELAAWIAAPLRQRCRDPIHGWSNDSYFSRLPTWMKLAKHRQAVLAAIGKLQARAATLAS